MSNSSDNGDGTDNKNGKLIVLPGGKKVDAEEMGTDYVVGTSGQIHMGELVDPAAVQRDMRERVVYVRAQPLVKALGDGDAGTAMDALLVEIAEEVSHLKYERRKATKEGKNTAPFTVARVNALRHLAETLIRRKETAMAERMDLKSPRLQKIFTIWMQLFYEAMEKSNVNSEIINVVFQQMKADMEGWESRMEDV